MIDKDSNKRRYNKQIVKTGSSGGIWFLGFIGALIYYLHVHAGTFWLVVLAFLKAALWPAFLVYHLLQFLHM